VDYRVLDDREMGAAEEGREAEREEREEREVPKKEIEALTWLGACKLRKLFGAICEQAAVC